MVKYDVEGEKISGVEGAESVERKQHTEKAVPQCFLSVGETALQPVSSGEKKEAKNIAQPISGSNFEAEQRSWHVQEVDVCKLLLKRGRYDALDVKGFTKEIVRLGSSSLVSRAVLYKKGVSATL